MSLLFVASALCVAVVAVAPLVLKLFAVGRP